MSKAPRLITDGDILLLKMVSRVLEAAKELNEHGSGDALDIVLRLKNEDARIKIVTHAADGLFRKGGLK